MLFVYSIDSKKRRFKHSEFVCCWSPHVYWCAFVLVCLCACVCVFNSLCHCMCVSMWLWWFLLPTICTIVVKRIFPPRTIMTLGRFAFFLFISILYVSPLDIFAERMFNVLRNWIGNSERFSIGDAIIRKKPMDLHGWEKKVTLRSWVNQMTQWIYSVEQSFSLRFFTSVRFILETARNLNHHIGRCFTPMRVSFVWNSNAFELQPSTSRSIPKKKKNPNIISYDSKRTNILCEEFSHGNKVKHRDEAWCERNSSANQNQKQREKISCFAMLKLLLRQRAWIDRSWRFFSFSGSYKS